MRAAATVIISSEVYVASGMTDSALQTPFEVLEIPGAEHVMLDPRFECLTFPGNGVPGLVKRVVALIVTLCVGGERAALHFAHRAQDPRGQHQGIGRSVQIIDNF